MITSKQVGTGLYASGLFGNRLRQFDTLEEAAVAVPPPYKLMLRQRKVNGGGISIHSLTLESARGVLASLSGETDLYFSEQIANQPHNIIFQGEYCYGGECEYLWFSTEKAFHREAMTRGQGYSGAGCRLIMQQFMDLPSYENIMTLAECYPDHTIEFTTCNEPVGNLRWNTITWEVRRY